MPRPSLKQLRELVGSEALPPDEKVELVRLVEQAEREPLELAKDSMRLRREGNQAKKLCAAAAEAATKLEKMLEELLHGSCNLTHLLTVRETDQGPMAVCTANGYCQELPVHPAVDVAVLKRLRSWEYVAVRQNLVVGYWSDDPQQFTQALGDIVQFRAVHDADRHLVRVQHGPEEKIVELDEVLWDEVLTPHSSLVLQRDCPHRAIALVRQPVVQSKFEVPISSLSTRLEDLAGLDSVAEQLLNDILLNTIHSNRRTQFGVRPQRGILLFSRPGMGKTALVRAVALWLYEHREQLGADIVLYSVKPNQTKSMWHGEDARIIREDLWGPIRARQRTPRERPLIQIVVFDEIDSLGKRPGAGQHVYSAAQSDALEALLVEMDGLVPNEVTTGPAAYVLCIGLTNRLDRVDEAVKRPGRFDTVLEMPEGDRHAAESVMAVYARGEELPWYYEDAVRTGVDDETVRKHFLRPALARAYDQVVVYYKDEAQRRTDVTAGELFSNAHYMDALNRARRRACLRAALGSGVPAVTPDDVLDCLMLEATRLATQVEADPEMLIRQLGICQPVTGVVAVPATQLQEYRHLRVHSA